MAYEKKVWKNRLSEFPNRRRLEPTGIENTYDVIRSEGEIVEEGNKFSEDEMNDLETRIDTSLNEQSSALSSHASDSSIHVTATEKAAWNGKANKTDIPSSLPANGGTADKASYSTGAVALTTPGLRNTTISSAAPTGGNSGDCWNQYK